LNSKGWGRRRWLGPLLLTLVWGLALAAAAKAVPQGGYAGPEILLQAEELKALMDRKDPNLRIIDFRHRAKYYLGHIPAAIQLWRPEITDRNQPWPGMPTPRAQMERLLGRLGIGPRNTLVIYSDQCDHTHLWWILAYYGFPLSQLKLLDGGLEAWKRKGYPTQLTSPRPQPTTFKFPAPGRKFLLAGLDQVKAALSSPDSLVLDVRPRDLYLGERTKEGAARRGHIPGAVWIYWREARVKEGPDKGCWQSAPEIRRLYESRGVTPDRDLYLYGHTDLCATYTLVSLYLAGYPLDKLHVYAGSWIQWSRSQEPVATGSSGPAK
jgi:thiosulfate/3-mercaptopyruvate sulfurtransferase